MDGQPPDDSDAADARSGDVRPLPYDPGTDQLIATIVKLLARRVAREIIVDIGERP